jgi:hypothetical protein
MVAPACGIYVARPTRSEAHAQFVLIVVVGGVMIIGMQFVAAAMAARPGLL